MFRHNDVTKTNTCYYQQSRTKIVLANKARGDDLYEDTETKKSGSRVRLLFPRRHPAIATTHTGKEENETT